MNLYALNPGLASKLAGFSKKYSLSISTLAHPSTFDSLIVIGNGTPDDWIVFLIAYHLDGEITNAIVKPDITGTSTFNRLRYYLTANPALKKLLFIVDEEVSTIDLISKELESRAKKLNIVTGNCVVDHEGRLKIYDCTIGNHDFKLLLVVNGLSAMASKKHTIEDHLLKVAESLGLVNLPEHIPDPKSFWHDSLSEEAKEIVFLRLKERKGLIESAFLQQMKGCNCLKA
jgi:hypothetical protein